MTGQNTGCNKTLRRKCITVTVRCYIHALCSTIDDFDADLIYGMLGFSILPNIHGVPMVGVTWTWNVQVTPTIGTTWT